MPSFFSCTESGSGGLTHFGEFRERAAKVSFNMAVLWGPGWNTLATFPIRRAPRHRP